MSYADAGGVRIVYDDEGPRADDGVVFLAGQQEFSAGNPWFSVKRLDGVTHFPALEIPDATAAGIENFLG